MHTLRKYFIRVRVSIAVVLGVAWFYKGGAHFKGVAAVCYGFLIGWLSGLVNAKSVYQKKSG
jgi:RsiW-degrading membrane proteinase PrsW (M82 family)